MTIVSDVAEKLALGQELIRKKQLDAALDVFLELYSSGETYVASTLGWLYVNINPPDLGRAAEFYRPEADGGDDAACQKLAGILYAQNRVDEAIPYFRKAADHNNIDCCYSLYRIYQKKNLNEEALYFLEKAAKARYPFAVRELCFSYMSGARGILNIPRGVVKYIYNTPFMLLAFLRYVQETQRR